MDSFSEASSQTSGLRRITGQRISALFPHRLEIIGMGFEKGDRVILHDKHSEFDGEVGEVSQVSETMFGDATYIVEFDEGQEAGIPADSLEAAADAGAAESGE